MCVDSLCEYSFNKCGNLDYIEMPINSNLSSIEQGTFCGSSIKSIFIPSKVTRIGEKAFCNCKQLKYVEFQNNSELKEIDNYAFESSSIEFISIPFRVEKIGDYAFCGCKKIKYIDFSECKNLYSIGKSAFSESMIRSFIAPLPMGNIGDCFNNCKNLSSVEFLNDEISLKSNFCQLENLSLISLPNAKKITIEIDYYNFIILIPSYVKILTKKVEIDDDDDDFLSNFSPLDPFYEFD